MSQLSKRALLEAIYKMQQRLWSRLAELEVNQLASAAETKALISEINTNLAKLNPNKPDVPDDIFVQLKGVRDQTAALAAPPTPSAPGTSTSITGP